MGSSTNVYTGLSAVSQGAFSDIWVYVALLGGIILAFYVIERLQSAIFPKSHYGDNSKKDV
jgi:hypothetical protein